MLRRFAFAAALTLAGATGAHADEARTAQYFDAIAGAPPLRTAFLRAMPKGGELHVHLTGAIYAENYIRWAVEDGLCVRRAGMALVPPPCDPAQGTEPAAILDTDRALRGAVIDSLSMRNHSDARDSGHDHFFATFGKFNASARLRFGDARRRAGGAEAGRHPDPARVPRRQAARAEAAVRHQCRGIRLRQALAASLAGGKRKRLAQKSLLHRIRTLTPLNATIATIFCPFSGVCVTSTFRFPAQNRRVASHK